METKVCASCKTEKNISEFGKASTRKDGLKPYCKECTRAKSKEHYHFGGGKKNLQKRQKDEEFKKHRKEYLKVYRQTEEGKAVVERGRTTWLESDRGKEYNKEYSKKYKQTEKYKEKAREYEKTTRKENALKQQNEFQQKNTHKLCTGKYSCGKNLSLSCFNKDKTTITGYEHSCRECKLKYKKSNKYKENLKNKQNKFKENNKTIICVDCNKELSLCNFQIKLDSSIGFKPVCKSCSSLRIKSDENINNIKTKQLEFMSNNNFKICSKCKEYKGLEEFDNDKYNSTGFRHQCKQCEKIYRNLIKEKYTPDTQQHYRNINPEKFCTLCSSLFPRITEFFTVNSSREDGLADYCKSCVSIYGKDKRSTEPYKKKAAEYQRNKKENDIQYKIRRNVSSMIYQRLRNRLASKETLSTFNDILPYTIEELMDHLEKQFDPGMTWDNYGCGEGKWEIDHYTPDSWFNYDSINDENFKESWKLENLQPAWSLPNRSKNNRYAGKPILQQSD